MVQTTKNASDAIKQKDEMQAELENLRQEHSKVEEAVQQSSQDANREKNELAERVQSLQKENASLTEKFDDLLANSSAEIAELKVNLDQFREDIEVGLNFCFFFLICLKTSPFVFNRVSKKKKFKMKKIHRIWKKSTSYAKRLKMTWNVSYRKY